MNVKTSIRVEHTKGGPAAPYNGDRDLKVSVRVDVTNADRGDAVVGSIDKALAGARTAVVDAIRASGSA